MTTTVHQGDLEKAGLLLAAFSGIIHFINGMRFVFFGALLRSIMLAAGTIILLTGLILGCAVLVGILVYWKFKVTGALMILLASIWGILVSGAFYFGPILGVFSAALLLYAQKSQIHQRQAIAMLIIGSIILAPLFLSISNQSSGYQYLTVNGIQRQYLIHVPESYDGSEQVPLLIALHGGGGDARNIQKSYGFDEISEQYGFIVVYPDGTGDLRYSLHTWNSGYIDAYASRNGIDDVEFIFQLILHLESEYQINTSAIYMTGHSNGAMMTYRFGAEHPEMLRGIAPVSGAVGGQVTDDAEVYIIPEPSQSLSVVHVHGLLDEQVLYSGGKGEKGFLAERVDLSVNDSIAFWVEHNNCSGTPIIETSSDDRIALWRFVGGSQSTEVLLVTLFHGNHSWLNMTGEVAGEEFIGTSLSEMIWLLLVGL